MNGSDRRARFVLACLELDTIDSGNADPQHLPDLSLRELQHLRGSPGECANPSGLATLAERRRRSPRREQRFYREQPVYQ